MIKTIHLTRQHLCATLSACACKLNMAGQQRVALVRNVALTLACSLMTTKAMAQLPTPTLPQDNTETCVIRGQINSLVAAGAKAKVKNVSLCVDYGDGNLVQVASTVTNKGRFRFNRNITPANPSMLYYVMGLGSGAIPVWVESGEVNIVVPTITQGADATVTGPTTNTLYQAYFALARQRDLAYNDSVLALQRRKGADFMATNAGRDARQALRSAVEVEWNANRMQFLLEHNDLPLAPLLINRDLLPLFNKGYVRQLAQCISPALAKHPYTQTLENNIKALSLGEGNEVPDIRLPQEDGRTIMLSDLRGKHVLLTFWASWAPGCLDEMQNLKRIYDETRDATDKFAMVNMSIDREKDAWIRTVKALGINRPGWLQAYDTQNKVSPSANLFGVRDIPKCILITPDGKTISFTLMGIELFARVKQILSGDLYYLRDESADEGN